MLKSIRLFVTSMRSAVLAAKCRSTSNAMYRVNTGVAALSATRPQMTPGNLGVEYDLHYFTSTHQRCMVTARLVDGDDGLIKRTAWSPHFLRRRGGARSRKGPAAAFKIILPIPT